jgi:hypothetical protein
MTTNVNHHHTLTLPLMLYFKCNTATDNVRCTTALPPVSHLSLFLATPSSLRVGTPYGPPLRVRLALNSIPLKSPLKKDATCQPYGHHKCHSFSLHYSTLPPTMYIEPNKQRRYYYTVSCSGTATDAACQPYGHHNCHSFSLHYSTPSPTLCVEPNKQRRYYCL